MGYMRQDLIIFFNLVVDFQGFSRFPILLIQFDCDAVFGLILLVWILIPISPVSKVLFFVYRFWGFTL